MSAARKDGEVKQEKGKGKEKGKANQLHIFCLYFSFFLSSFAWKPKRRGKQSVFPSFFRQPMVAIRAPLLHHLLLLFVDTRQGLILTIGHSFWFGWVSKLFLRCPLRNRCPWRAAGRWFKSSKSSSRIKDRSWVIAVSIYSDQQLISRLPQVTWLNDSEFLSRKLSGFLES